MFPSPHNFLAIASGDTTLYERVSSPCNSRDRWVQGASVGACAHVRRLITAEIHIFGHFVLTSVATPPNIVGESTHGSAREGRPSNI
jgi:hypothetical protein